MGGSSSSEASGPVLGSAHIQLDAQTYHAGAAITGTVYFIVQQGMIIDQLFLRLSGQENTHWTERRRSGKHSRTVHFRGSNVIVNHVAPIYRCSDSFLAAGQYAFPFVFNLPQNLPGTASTPSTMHATGSILYQLIFEASPQNGAQLKVVAPLGIIQLLNQQIQPMESKSDQSLSVCGCFERGNLKLQVNIDKNCYTPNENCIFTVSVDCGSSDLDIERIDVSLDNYITLTCSTGYSRQFPYSILQTTLEGCSSKETAQKQFQLPLQNAAQSLFQCQTAKGSIFQSNYRIQLKCFMKSNACCTSSPTAIIPVVIYLPQMPPLQPPPAPEGFNPTEMPQAQLQMQQAQLYDPNLQPPPADLQMGYPVAMPQQQYYGPQPPQQYQQPMPQQYGQYPPQQEQQPTQKKV